MGQEGENRKTGKPNWKEEAQSTELEKQGGVKEVNRGRGEICVTAAAWGSPTEQRGMLLMDMSDIVLTSSLWILQQTHTHWILHAYENIRHTDTLFQACSCEKPALKTILSKPSPTYSTFTFVTLDLYIVCISSFIPFKTCISEG